MHVLTRYKENRDELLLLAIEIISKGGEINCREASRIMVDYYKMLLLDAGITFGHTNFTHLPIKTRLILLGIDIPEIKSIEEFPLIEGIRNKTEHDETAIPNSDHVEKLIHLAESIEKRMDDLISNRLDEQVKIKTAAEKVEFELRKSLGELEALSYKLDETGYAEAFAQECIEYHNKFSLLLESIQADFNPEHIEALVTTIKLIEELSNTIDDAQLYRDSMIEQAQLDDLEGARDAW